MDTPELLLVALAMAVGLVGVLVPVLPGLALVWAAVLVWALSEDSMVRWVVLALATLLLVAGTVAKYVLPARSATRRGAPQSSLLLAGVLAVVGFFVVPVVGFVLGGLGGLFGAEYLRLREVPAAWSSTWAALRAVGAGLLVELAAALAIVLTWAVGVVLS
ncbi:MAG: DUF456 domain-containing protein [Actinomycetes bacterium]